MGFISQRLKENGELLTSSVFSAIFWLISGYVFKFGSCIIDHQKVTDFQEVLNGFFTEQASLVFLIFSAIVFLVMYWLATVFIKDEQFSGLLAIKAWELIFNAVYSLVSYIVIFQSLSYSFLYFVAMMAFSLAIIIVNPAKNKSKNQN